MGCIHSKPGTRRGLHTQQEEFIDNNNKVLQGATNDKVRVRASPQPPMPTNVIGSHHPSRHSPPVPSKPSNLLPSLEGLGSLSEVWSMPKQWDKYRQYLATIREGEDSEGLPLTMVRYAMFLEMYARLDMEYRRGAGRDMLMQMVEEIADHREGFLDRERCLKCVESGMRKEVLERIKNVKHGKDEPGPNVFILIYPRVVDRLGEMLGNYQNMRIMQNRQ